MIDTMKHGNCHGNNIENYEAEADATQQLICHGSFLGIHSIFFISDHWKQQKVSEDLHNQKEKNIKCHHFYWRCWKFWTQFVKWCIFHYVESLIDLSVDFFGCEVKIHFYWNKRIWPLKERWRKGVSNVYCDLWGDHWFNNCC